MSEPSHSTSRAAGWISLALAGWLSLAVVQVVLGFAGSGGAVEEDLVYRFDFALGGALVYAILIGLTVAIGRSQSDPLRALGLRRPSRRAAWAAAAVLLVALVVSAALEPVLRAGEQQGITPEHWHPDRVAALLASAATVSLVGPFAEELFFRGLGMHLLGRFGLVLAAGIQASLWTLAHGLLAAIPALLLFGVLLGWLRARTGSVWPAVGAHAAYNALGLAAAVASAM